MRGTNNRTYALQPAYDFVYFNRKELVIMRLPFPDYFTLSLKQNNETAKEFDETPFEEILPPFYFTRTAFRENLIEPRIPNTGYAVLATEM